MQKRGVFTPDSDKRCQIVEKTEEHVNSGFLYVRKTHGKPQKSENNRIDIVNGILYILKYSINVMKYYSKYICWSWGT